MFVRIESIAGSPVLPDSQEKVVSWLLVASTGFARGISLFRYSLGTIYADANDARGPLDMELRK